MTTGEIRRNWHSIIGPNGMCECGVDEAGLVTHCADLLAKRYSVEDIDEIVGAITAVVREADEGFQQSGGSSRHWARDWFLPLLYRRGWRLEKAASSDAVDPVRATEGSGEAPQADHARQEERPQS